MIESGLVLTFGLGSQRGAWFSRENNDRECTLKRPWGNGCNSVSVPTSDLWQTSFRHAWFPFPYVAPREIIASTPNVFLNFFPEEFDAVLACLSHSRQSDRAMYRYIHCYLKSQFTRSKCLTPCLYTIKWYPQNFDKRQTVFFMLVVYNFFTFFTAHGGLNQV